MNSLLIAGNIIKRAFRSKKELVALIVLPALAIGAITLLIGQGTQKPLQVGIVDLDDSTSSQQLTTYTIEQPGTKEVVLTEQNYREAVVDRTVDLALLIPSGFGSGIEQNRNVQVTLYALENSAKIAGAQQAINRFIATLHTAESAAATLAQQTGGVKSAIAKSIVTEVRTGPLTSVYNVFGADTGVNRESFNSAIGFALIFIMAMVFTVIGTMMEDKRNLTLARMFVSPTREWEIVLGNLLGGIVLGSIQLVPILLILRSVFDISWAQGFPALALTLFCFLIATVGLGIGLSGIVKKGVDPVVIIATVIVPTSILGGSMIPESMLPDVMNRIGYAVPQKWVMRAVYDIISGGGVGDVALNLGVLLMFGLAFASFGVKSIRPLDE